jgi:hypothetical protein
LLIGGMRCIITMLKVLVSVAGRIKDTSMIEPKKSSSTLPPKLKRLSDRMHELIAEGESVAAL